MEPELFGQGAVPLRTGGRLYQASVAIHRSIIEHAYGGQAVQEGRQRLTRAFASDVVRDMVVTQPGEHETELVLKLYVLTPDQLSALVEAKANALVEQHMAWAGKAPRFGRG